MPVPYDVPTTPSLLVLASFLYFINVANYISSKWIHACLIGPLVIGVVYGSQAANILADSLQSTLISFGYIGLLLIVFEAGLTTDVSLLYKNMAMSLAVAVTGITLPILFSIVLLRFGYGYSPLQSFAAGAALCSTSLGTTLSLLDPSLRQTRVGSVLMSAALIDDIAGLVIAAIISQLSDSSSGPIPWQTIVRPILVSLAFALGTPMLAWALRYGFLIAQSFPVLSKFAFTGSTQLFLAVATLSAFVAGSQYAGTSELFGAYLAGVLLTHVFTASSPRQELELNLPNAYDSHPSDKRDYYTPQLAFERFITPLLSYMLLPIFFASIGSALPIRALASVDGSHAVIWRGIAYSLLMAFAKFAVGIWMVIWPDSGYRCLRIRAGKRRRRPQAENDTTASVERSSDAAPIADLPAISVQRTITHKRSALLLGFAMVARGEIALIVAQLARPLLESGDGGKSSEPFAVVIWAILVTTVGGAVGVGLVLRGITA